MLRPWPACGDLPWSSTASPVRLGGLATPDYFCFFRASIEYPSLFHPYNLTLGRHSDIILVELYFGRTLFET